MTPDQQMLPLVAVVNVCTKCGAPIPYAGVGRPRTYCDRCRPGWFAPLKKVNRPVSGQSEAPTARRSDPDTSHAAAASVNGTAVESLILEAFEQFGALTDDELVDVLDGPHGPTVKSARSRLAKAGCLVDSGMRRPSNRSRAMVVWEAAP